MIEPDLHPAAASASSGSDLTRPGERLRLTIELERGSEPVSGIVSGDGLELPFVGWLALASAIGRFSN